MNSQTVIMGLLGHPVSHSLSPLMHNRAFDVLGLNMRYAAFDVEPARIGEAVASIRALGLRGVNVTIPHKVGVMEHLDEIDEEARFIGAVNTIVNENGRLIGYNTDGRGYVRSLVEETGVVLAEQSALMLGAGGAARGVAFALLASGLPKLIIANRTREKADSLVRDLGRIYPQAQLTAICTEEVDACVADVTLLIQTTSIGMHPHIDVSPLDAKYLHDGLLVSDLIYNPLDTKLLRDAAYVGARTHRGVGMFIYQGALSFEYWTKQQAPAQEMRETVMDALTHRK
ncbi:shikimate dehydrogenase [Aneurinibacillus uraniidurans]|uniref:shikimate dehydrogenase n=1 Tax=Aneurinibacillus uraniidurans TaxID=2966586 RepID=UPI00234AD48D|nr:shikimate dehydrogenase [Aneurinibacillus sp. B1]WCN38699.1 shikimate dehydrogenase [Aneurinibacillus sp. B1]